MGKMNRTVSLLSLLAIGVSADMSVEYVGTPWNDAVWTEKTLTITNNTNTPWLMAGLRFSTPEYAWTGCPSGSIKTVNGSGPYYMEVGVPNIDENFGINGYSRTFKISGSPGGKDGTPSNTEFILKTGSPFWPLEIPYSEPVLRSQIDSLMNSADFYDPDLAVMDTLGQRGGPMSGGMIDTWVGLTQLQSAFPTEPFNQNATWMTFEPKAYGNPLYMMTLAAMQEYLNIDMQVLVAKGGKENMAGMVQWDSDNTGPTTKMGPIYGTGNNGLSNVDFSPFSVEYQTFADNIYAPYPKFFPLGSKSPEGSAAADYYTTTSGSGGYCQLNSPNVVNGTFIACLYNWFTYQLATNATDYGIADLISKGKDKIGALKLALWAFNRGIYSGFEKPISDPDVFEYEKIEEYPGIASNGKEYIVGIVAALDPIVEAQKNSVTLGGTEPVFDDTISISMLEKFFFGTGGDGSSGSRGEGGLLVHFDLTESEMQELWSDVNFAFDKMKGKAPSTSGEPEMVSYRYDFLTILRVAKQYLNLTIDLPTTSVFRQWTASRSSNSTTFGGLKKDSEAPFMTVADTITADSLSFELNITDNDNIVTVEWSVDEDWNRWNRASKVSGDSLNAVFRATIDDGELQDFQGTESPTVWLRATDLWGNTVVQKVAVDYEVSTVNAPKTASSSLLTGFTVTESRKISLELSQSVQAGSRVAVYNLHGQQIYSQQITGQQAVSIDMNGSAAGVYLLRLTSGSAVHTERFCVK